MNGLPSNRRVDLRAAVAVFAACALAACSDGAATTTGSHGGAGGNGGGGNGGGGNGGGGAVPVGPPFTCVAPGEPTYQPYSNDPVQVPLCEDPDRLTPPSEALLVDLGDTQIGAIGTCASIAADPAVEGRALDPSLGFPQRLRLPAITAADPACAALCDLGPEPTAFGLTVHYPDLALGSEDRLLAIRVPPPWYLVIGNEHSPTPCMDGRPSVLEYGQPLSCAVTWGAHIGFATSDAAAPSVDVLVDLLAKDDLPNTPMCCPYTCP